MMAQVIFLQLQLTKVCLFLIRLQVRKKHMLRSASGYINILTENDSVGRHLSDVNISGVSNGDGLIFNSAQGRFNVGALPSTGFSIAMAVEHNKEKRWHKTLEDMYLTM